MANIREICQTTITITTKTTTITIKALTVSGDISETIDPRVKRQSDNKTNVVSSFAICSTHTNADLYLLPLSSCFIYPSFSPDKSICTGFVLQIMWKRNGNCSQKLSPITICIGGAFLMLWRGIVIIWQRMNWVVNIVSGFRKRVV